MGCPSPALEEGETRSRHAHVVGERGARRWKRERHIGREGGSGDGATQGAAQGSIASPGCKAGAALPAKARPGLGRSPLALVVTHAVGLWRRVAQGSDEVMQTVRRVTCRRSQRRSQWRGSPATAVGTLGGAEAKRATASADATEELAAVAAGRGGTSLVAGVLRLPLADQIRCARPLLLYFILDGID